MGKLDARAFAAFLEECADRKDGYIMGTIGQDPKKLSSWYFDQYSGDQKKKALYWRDNAKRVWDCQGLAEGYINDMTGSKINVRARNNYATWCSPKGSGAIPNQYKLPGAAVFIYSSSSGAITHVGYLVRPVDKDKPDGDWWVVEARGVMYGVVRTKLYSRSWNRWGLMTMYFDYGSEEPVYNIGDRELREGMEGPDVKQLQTDLISLGYSCGKWGADGEFGPATKQALNAFKAAYNLDANGIFDDVTATLLKQLIEDNDEAPGQKPEPEHKMAYLVTGGSVNLRTGPGTQFSVVKIVRKGDRLAPLMLDGWEPVALPDNEVAFISAKYVDLGVI